MREFSWGRRFAALHHNVATDALAGGVDAQKKAQGIAALG
jgi:hypothetical protein